MTNSSDSISKIDNNIPLSKHLPGVGQIAYGCMGLGGGWNDNTVTAVDIKQTRSVIDTALESGINLFDHADIYTFSKAEQAFGQALQQAPELRDQMFIQSKCGIRFEGEGNVGRYDFSAGWVSQSVEGILNRLNTEKLDVLFLHRPDPLMELDELARTLENLKAQGKVDFFGVSNMNSHQIQYLQSALGQPIVANQIEMSLAKLDWLNDGVMINSQGHHQSDFAAGTLEHCQMKGIQLQAWGCLAQGRFAEQGLYSEHENVKNTAHYVAQLANQYGVESEAIVLAFLLRHPAGIQPVIGTTNLGRIKASSEATQINLTREEWYNLYVYSRGQALP
ncbi:aldo/keto reductase [Vibrio sp. Isolate22]|uniref:aldo/keto reductase n=1 Tax=Vibrio sp. Isolate22 TaxID=2908532 RepID=UPI001EFD6A74|nr:aldo/keto reductase [Vibrio sp. Isolate22]MCG9694437.1 aldo/keto reductase [Vibrio sp. Isolate22]